MEGLLQDEFSLRLDVFIKPCNVKEEGTINVKEKGKGWVGHGIVMAEAVVARPARPGRSSPPGWALAAPAGTGHLHEGVHGPSCTTTPRIVSLIRTIRRCLAALLFRLRLVGVAL